jgi:hypothetical protein
MEFADLKPHLRDGMSILFGGFMGVGTPPGIVGTIFNSGARIGWGERSEPQRDPLSHHAETSEFANSFH